MTPAVAHAESANRILAGHVPALAKSVPPIGLLPATNQLNLAIWLPLRDRIALTNLLEETYNPSSANYRQFLSPQQFTDRFSPSDADYEAVIQFARANGLHLTGRHGNRILVDVAGSVSDIERAFNIVLRTYPHPSENREFYAPDREPSVDAALPVLSIDGLNNVATLQSALNAEGAWQTLTGSMGSGPSGSYLGADFRKAYAPGVTLNGAGQILGLLEFSGFETNDVLDYEAQAGLPNVPVINALLPGASPIPSTNEVALNECVVDIEMAVSMATGLAKVVVFVPAQAPGGLGDALAPYFGDLLNTMVSSNQIKQFSSSWGYVGLPEPNPGYDQVFMQMALQGQAFFQASGDADAWVNQIWVPAASPYVTCVGATTLTMNGTAASYASETVWNSGNEANQWGPNMTYSWGSGGGVSPDYAIPGYQQGINMAANGGSTTLRNIPDVAMVGDNIWLVFHGGSAAAASGTSMSTPLWAAFTALANQQAAIKGAPPVGFLNPALYAIGRGTNYTNCFHDVVNGNNTGEISPTNYYAVQGYDLCTGWGSPTGSNLINALVIQPDPFRIIPGMGFVSTGYVGGPFSSTSTSLTLSNAGPSSLNWSLGGTSAWLQASANGGTLAAGRIATVTANLTGAASNLPAGNYAATLSFTNKSDGVVQGCMFMLEVTASLAITPSQGFASTGFVGGPFTVTNESLTLSNSGSSALRWSLVNTSLWLNALPGGGTLAPGARTNVSAKLTGVATNLAAGTYAATVLFNDQSNGTVQFRAYSLDVVEPMAITPAQGFASTGYAGGPFTVTNESLTLTNSGPSAVTWSLANTSLWLNAAPGNGTLAASGGTTNVLVGLAGSAWSLATGSYTTTILITNRSDGTVFGRAFNLVADAPVALTITPAQGFVSTGYVGGPFSITNQILTVSNTGSLVAPWSVGNTPSWLNVSPTGGTLDAAGGNTNIMTGLSAFAPGLAAGNYAATVSFTNLTDGLAQNCTFSLVVSPLPAPRFQSVRVTNGTVNLTWGTAPTLKYQLQYAADLAAGNWSNLGSAFTATNISAAESDTPGSAAHRFYRVVVLP